MAHMAEPEDRRVAGFVIILMGVSGAGKSTVGARLARELGWIFWMATNCTRRQTGK